MSPYRYYQILYSVELEVLRDSVLVAICIGNRYFINTNSDKNTISQNSYCCMKNTVIFQTVKLFLVFLLGILRTRQQNR